MRGTGAGGFPGRSQARPPRPARGPSPGGREGGLIRHLQLFSYFTSAPCPRVGRLNLSHQQRWAPPRAGWRGSREPPQGDGAAAMPSSLALQAPSLSTGGPGATLAGPGRGSCPVLS